MLVHMSPGEVHGLQALAKAHGGSLTINPQTGLPEAGFLSSILPIAAGAALTAMGVPPPLAAMMVGGVGAVATGSLGKGLMMGLGAYGGAGLGGALSAAGAAETAASGALTDATVAGTTTNAAANAALQQAPQQIPLAYPGEQYLPGGPTTYTAPAPVPTAAPSVDLSAYPNATARGAELAAKQDWAGLSRLAGVPEGAVYGAEPIKAAPSFSNMGQGISNLMSSGPTGDQARAAFMQDVGGGKGLAKYGLAAAAPMLYEGMQPKPLQTPDKQPYEYYKTSYSQQRNPLYGQPGQPYFIQSYAPGSFTTNPKEVIGVRGGGLMAFADGGYVPESGKVRMPGPGQEEDESRTPKTSFEFGGYAPDKGNPLKNMSELQLKMLAARSRDPELKGRAISELYVRQSTASPSQGFMSAEDYTKGAAGGGLMSLADGGAVPTASPLFQQVQTPPPDALNNYLANLGQSLMGVQPQPQMTPATYTPVEPAAPAPTAGGGFSGGLSGAVEHVVRKALNPAPAPSTHQYMFNPATQTFGINPGYVAPVAPVAVDDNGGGSEGSGDAAGGSIKARYAAGGLGSLPEYAAGGKLLDGPGDGVSDSIPAVIKGPKPQRAALADGEFVIPARIVSELGNGSTKAGAKRLYAMMDRVQNARRKTTGKDRVAVNTRPDSLLPA